MGNGNTGAFALTEIDDVRLPAKDRVVIYGFEVDRTFPMRSFLFYLSDRGVEDPSVQQNNTTADLEKTFHGITFDDSPNPTLTWPQGVLILPSVMHVADPQSDAITIGAHDAVLEDGLCVFDKVKQLCDRHQVPLIDYGKFKALAALK